MTCDGGAVNQGRTRPHDQRHRTALTTGSIANTAVVDPNNTIAESNELNNTSATVTPRAGPAAGAAP